MGRVGRAFTRTQVNRLLARASGKQSSRYEVKPEAQAWRFARYGNIAPTYAGATTSVGRYRCDEQAQTRRAAGVIVKRCRSQTPLKRATQWRPRLVIGAVLPRVAAGAIRGCSITDHSADRAHQALAINVGWNRLIERDPDKYQALRRRLARCSSFISSRIESELSRNIGAISVISEARQAEPR